MLPIPVHGYEVEFIPLERRLLDRRIVPRAAMVLDGIKADRREDHGRRLEDRDPPPQLKVVR
jgi:hypothetical protein